MAPGAAGAEPFSLTQPTGAQRGRMVLAVVDHALARPTGGIYCDPSEGPESCLRWPVFQGSAEIVRYLSRRPEGWRHPGRFPQVRFVAGGSSSWIAPGVRLELLEQTADDHLYLVWSVSAEDDLVCLPRQLTAQFQIRPRGIRYRSRDEQRDCFRLSDVD
ncbi:MAG TPA: hypothetical protein VES64_02725 [Allosphingosinicella sp.]|nr:hypothetical protein [Allosphingosinicella sp.]